jgi:hypothetical protein
MIPQTDPNTDCMPDWYDPFVEPNTMPKSWDLSEHGYVNRSREALEHDRQAKEASPKAS